MSQLANRFSRRSALRLTLLGVPLAGGLGFLAPNPVGLAVSVLLAWQIVLVVLCAGLVSKPHRQYMLVSTSCGLYLCAAVGIAQLWFSPQSDSVGYYSTALHIAGYGGEAVYAPQGTGREGYVLVLSTVFRLGDPSFVIPVLVNAGALAASAVFFFRPTLELAGAEAARLVPGILFLWPPILMWGTQGLREAFVYLGLAGMSMAAIAFERRATLVAILGFGLTAAYLLIFRGAIAVSAPIAAVVGATIGGMRVGRLARVVATAVVGLAIFMLFTAYSGAGSLTDSYADADQVARARKSMARADTGFGGGGVTFATVAIGVLRVFAGPLPWEWGNVPLVFVLDFVWAAGALLLIGLAVGRLGLRVWLPLLLPASVIAASIAAGITNYGTLLRVRVMVFVVLVPLMATGLHSVVQRVRARPRLAESAYRIKRGAW